jgi:hypothetical protein
MPNTKQSIHLNNCVLSTLRAGVEVSFEPPGVHVCGLLVLLILGHVGGGGSNANGLSDRVPPPGGRHHPTNRSAVIEKTKDHDDIVHHHHSLATRKV